jgi:hypothetical protein
MSIIALIVVLIMPLGMILWWICARVLVAYVGRQSQIGDACSAITPDGRPYQLSAGKNSSS